LFGSGFPSVLCTFVIGDGWVIVVQLLDNRNKSVYDPDELEDEDKERMLRMRLNKAFKKFVEQVSQFAVTSPPSAS
jgi:hypothetical protein